MTTFRMLPRETQVELYSAYKLVHQARIDALTDFRQKVRVYVDGRIFVFNNNTCKYEEVSYTLNGSMWNCLPSDSAMNPKNILFSFDDLSSKDKATRQVTKYFARAGATVVMTDVPQTTKRTSGVSFREMTLTFADSQKVTFRIKQTGDIYQVLLNDKVVPIRNQDDHIKAVAEIVGHMDAGRSKFQKQLAKAAVKPPPGIRTAAPKLEAVLTQKRDDLKESIRMVREEIATLQAA